MKLEYKTQISAIALIMTMATAMPVLAQQSDNVLVNGGFEADSVPNWGNNINVNQSGKPSGWTFGGGSRPNIVKMDGPGGQATWYNNSGPESDANTSTGAGVTQHYLDITRGRNNFYQTFTPTCSGEVEFGGAFSTRGNSSARASITIRNGDGLNGSVVGQTNTINMPGGTSKTDPWTPVSFTTVVTAGQTYSFVVAMGDNSNFDEAFVRFQAFCPGTLDPVIGDPYVVADPPVIIEPGVLDTGPAVVMDPATPPRKPPPPPVPMGDHFQCYMLKEGDQIKQQTIYIKDQFGESQAVLGRPVMICNPSSKTHNGKRYPIKDKERHLVCYNYVKQGRVENQDLHINTQFGADKVVAVKRELFCAPAGKAHLKKGEGARPNTVPTRPKPKPTKRPRRDIQRR